MELNAPPWAWIQTPAPHHRAYAERGLWEGRTIADLAIERATEDPDFILFAEGDREISRAELLAEAEALSVALGDLGLVKGDVVSFQTPNWIEAAVINLAATMSGFIINPIVPIYRDAEVGMMLSDCRAKAFFVAGQFRNYDFAAMAARLLPSLPHLAHVIQVRGDAALSYNSLLASGHGRRFDRPQVDANDIKMLLYTSGTTGRPKGVLHNHNARARLTQQAVAHWGIKPGDAQLIPSPVTHISGFSNGLEMPFVSGTRSILMESWNAKAALQLIERYGVTGTVAATPFLTELASVATAAGTRLHSLRFFACGGAAVSPAVVSAAKEAFANCAVFRVFGSTEVPLVTLGYPAAADAELGATTDGAVIDYEVRVVDEAGSTLPAGSEGEIQARGPCMMVGYMDRAQTNEAITQDGYFRTGDLGMITRDGAILITGRKKDLIIRGGENISAKEIEDVLHLHPEVQEAAIVAMPHARLGEGVCAYVIARADGAVDATMLSRHIETSGLAKQKIPEHFEFVTELPRTPSGKVRKDLLRANIRTVVEESTTTEGR